MVQVSPSLVKRQKTHFHDLPCGASVILGNNGFIWIYPTPEQKEEDAGGFTANLEVSDTVASSPWSGAQALLCLWWLLSDYVAVLWVSLNLFCF